jgi:hypothetical protein
MRAATIIAQQIKNENPCFGVQETSLHEARLRCAGSRGPTFQEYLIVVSAEERKAFLMYSSIDSEAELIGYPIAVRDFKRRAKG